MKTKNLIAEILHYRCAEPILESTIKPLNTNKLPDKFGEQVDILRHTACHNGVVSLSANQVNIETRMFAVLRRQYIQAGKWVNYENLKPHFYDIVANPKIQQQSKMKFKDLEECCSLEGIQFAIWVPVRQVYKYYAPVPGSHRMQELQVSLRGFQARVWDHETRHLDGILPIHQLVSHFQFHMKDEYRINPLYNEAFQLVMEELRHYNTSTADQFFQQPKEGSIGSQQVGQTINEQMRKKLLEAQEAMRNWLGKEK